jgi:hypothetical protein
MNAVGFTAEQGNAFFVLVGHEYIVDPGLAA